MDPYAQLVAQLPPLVEAMVWDVVNGRITPETIALARRTSEDEFKRYDVVWIVVPANPSFPPVEEAQALLKLMLACSLHLISPWTGAFQPEIMCAKP